MRGKVIADQRPAGGDYPQQRESDAVHVLPPLYESPDRKYSRYVRTGSRDIPLAARFGTWVAAAAASLAADVTTKALPHELILLNPRPTPWPLLVIAGIALLVLGLWGSPILAVGAGLMFGGLCGNGGQLLIDGAVSDWLRFGDWVTNIADLSGFAGLLICVAGFILRRLKT
ncbi:MAG TPA: hypothetical protein VFA78_03540 [Chloroflexota bacterium]|nr:hypothetical protein [Chloroflexota bacterium]